MLDEILVMNNRKVWTLVQKPNNNKIIGCRWVFTVKNDDQGKIVRYKARLVAQGFKQMKGIHYDEVFSPVVNFEIVRLCFSIFVCKLQWSHCQSDVKCAYLYAPLDENILMSQPQGFEDPNKPEYVCKLNKSIYGLHQSGRNWFLEIHNVLENMCILKKVDENQHLKRVDLAKELGLTVTTLNMLIDKHMIIEECHHQIGSMASKKLRFQSGKIR
ncbi:Retrovirus-related Pol polyprotein from transposon TNT 1-94 [Araneus ventricosus]|uniref:Retrovirus-related Pol polyprotein from transposon TNT 1-94 n=1 Tax=Araneus ventricosus TaxID=182803 RepID=A0A4Y2FX92_ARAVE|nr:Retrovirus-related Pol polyprotein from transposon TNT 1-94 [Araneus ventricosus]